MQTKTVEYLIAMFLYENIGSRNLWGLIEMQFYPKEKDICIECVTARGRRKGNDPNLCNHEVFKVSVCSSSTEKVTP